MKKTLSLFLALALLLALGVPVMAADYAPLTVNAHYWSAKTFGYDGTFTFSAAKVGLEKTTNTGGQHTEERTVKLKPGSTVTVKEKSGSFVPPEYDAQIVAFTYGGEEYWLYVKAGTYTAEEFFAGLDQVSYQKVSEYRSGEGNVGPFSRLLLATADVDSRGNVQMVQYTITLEGAAAPTEHKVVLSPQNLMVDGELKDVEKYNIDDSNYFKLRDIAYMLKGTGSRFSVGWDAATGTVSIVTGETYEPNGSEMIVGADKSATAVPSAQTIVINGEVRSDLSVFNLSGNNFFKLRDLGDALGFAVDYDPVTNTAIIVSSPSP